MDSTVNPTNVPASNPLTKKLNKILETRLDNDKVCIFTGFKMLAQNATYFKSSKFG